MIMNYEKDVNKARKLLAAALGDTMKVYFENMKKWFKMKITKEDFDALSRTLLSPEQVHLHNQFLVALFARCNLVGKDKPVPRFVPAPNMHEERFEMADYFKHVPVATFKAQPNKPVQLCKVEACLPDPAMIHGRLYVIAWELGLDGVSDSVLDYMVLALQLFVKNILTAVLSKKKGYRIRDNHLIHSVGKPVPDPWRRNYAIGPEASVYGSSSESHSDTDYHPVPIMRPTVQEAQQIATQQIAAANYTGAVNPPVNLMHLYQALQVEKSIIPNHAVYVLNMERIVTKLWHPNPP